MSQTQQRCQRCPRPAPAEAYLCGGCRAAAARELQVIAELLPDAQTTVARLDRHSSSPAGAGHDHPLPVNLSAAGRVDQAEAEVLAAVRQVALASGRPFPPPAAEAPAGPVCRDAGRLWPGPGCGHGSCVVPPAPDAGAAAGARWLAGQLEWVAGRPWAGGLVEQLHAVRGSVERMVDRPPERRYLGECGAARGAPVAWPCPGDVVAAPDADWAYCRLCRAPWEVAARVRWLEGLTRERSFTAAEIGAAHGVPAGTIRQWAYRGRLADRGTDQHGRPLYRLDEVLSLVAEQKARALRRQRRKERQA